MLLVPPAQTGGRATTADKSIMLAAAAAADAGAAETFAVAGGAAPADGAAGAAVSTGAAVSAAGAAAAAGAGIECADDLDRLHRQHLLLLLHDSAPAVVEPLSIDMAMLQVGVWCCCRW